MTKWKKMSMAIMGMRAKKMMTNALKLMMIDILYTTILRLTLI